MCPQYRAQGHPIQERTVLVGYACERHSQYQTESLLWSSNSESSARQTRRGDSSEGILSAQQGIKITSAVALRALEDAQYRETDDDQSTERLDESVMETASTQTTVDEDPRDEAKPQSVPNHRFKIDISGRDSVAPANTSSLCKNLKKESGATQLSLCTGI